MSADERGPIGTAQAVVLRVEQAQKDVTSSLEAVVEGNRELAEAVKRVIVTATAPNTDTFLRRADRASRIYSTGARASAMLLRAAASLLRGVAQEVGR